MPSKTIICRPWCNVSSVGGIAPVFSADEPLRHQRHRGVPSLMSSPRARSQKQLVHDYFNAEAEAWRATYSVRGELPSLLIQERGQKVMEYVDSLALPRGARVLDLGCGAGLVSRQLVERGFQVVGIDVAESMLELARKNCADIAAPGQAEFRIGDVGDLDLPEASFDLIIAMGLIEYLEWDRWALQQMHRVLRIGGHLIVTVPNLLRLSHLDPWYLLVQGKRVLRKRWGKWLGKTPPPRSTYFDRYYVVSQLRRRLETLGFEVESWYSHGFGPFWSLQRFRRLSLGLHRLFGNLSRVAPFLKGLGSDVVLLCRAQPSLFGVHALRPFPEPELFRKAFESRKNRQVRIRETWLDQHPRYRSATVKPFEAEGAKDVLVLAPHPDDEIIGCGGTLLKLVGGGSRVAVIYATDGSSSAALANLPEELRTTVRLEHAREVGNAAGFEELIFWKRGQGSDLLAEACVDDLV